jgi:hypothetical protein
MPGSGNLRRLSRRTVTNKTSQAADLKGGGLRYLAFTYSYILSSFELTLPEGEGPASRSKLLPGTVSGGPSC